MNDKINLTKPDGTQVNGDVICFLENKDTKKRYLYYTLNEIVGADTSSTVKIYVSKIKQDDPNLDAQITDEEWNMLKGYMGDALKDSINPSVTYLSLTELGTPVSVSERAIAMPTSYDYINKQRGIYAQNIATQGIQESTIPQVPVEPVAPVEPTVATIEPAAIPVEPTVAAVEPPAPINPTPIVEPTPVASPQPINPTVEPVPTPAALEPVAVEPTIAPVSPAPSIEPAPIEQPQVVDPAPLVVEPPVVEPLKVEPVPAPIEPTNNNIKQEPIDIASIEKKYADMIDSINKLKEQEIEAVKRYNATIELSSMHNEQHANYVQNEQIKENNIAPAPIANPEPAPIAPTPVVNNQPVTPGPVGVEPTIVSPVVPEPQVQPANIETNWFDMPENN